MTVLRSVTNPITEILTAGEVVHPNTIEDLPAYQRTTNPASNTFSQKKGVLGKKIVLNKGVSNGSYIKQSHKNPLWLNVKLQGSDADTMYNSIRNLLLSVPMGCVWNFKLHDMGCSYLREDIKKEIGEIYNTFFLDPASGYESVIKQTKERADCDKIGFDGDTIFLKDNKECCITSTPPSNDGSGGSLFLRLSDVDKAEDLTPLIELFDTLVAFFALLGKDISVQIEDKRTPNDYIQKRIYEQAEDSRSNLLEKSKKILSKIIPGIKFITWDVVRRNMLGCDNSYADKNMESNEDPTKTLFPLVMHNFDGTTYERAYYIPHDVSHPQGNTKTEFLNKLYEDKLAHFKRDMASNHELGRRFYTLIQDSIEKAGSPEAKKELLRYLQCIEEVVPGFDDYTKHRNENGMKE